MAHLPQTLTNIMAAGGNLVVESSNYLPDTLILLAKAARANNVQLTVKAANELPQTLISIVDAGGSNVTIVV